jgi:lysophospholipase L1-like esterase
MHFRLLLSSLLLASATFAGIPPNPALSDTVYLSNGTKNVYLSDNVLYTAVSDTSFAFHVGQGPSKLFLTWLTTPYEGWANNIAASVSHNEIPLSDFALLASANSTTGFDGTWDTVAVIDSSKVSSRGLLVDFTGKSWIRFSMKKAVSVYDARVFDASNGAKDSWFFLGTSITQMAFNGNALDTTFAQQVTAFSPKNTPATVFGGVGGVNSSEVSAHLATYLSCAGNVKFWAIEMGTNDAWSGSTWNLSTYLKNMQQIIDSAKARGIVPIIARIPATDSTKAGWQISPLFLDSLDSLVARNGLQAGPDLYSWFHKHPEELNGDGVHPNAVGAASIQRLWAKAVAPLYADSSTVSVSRQVPAANLSVSVHENLVQLSGLSGGSTTAALFTVTGKRLETHALRGTSGSFESHLPHGIYLLQLKSETGIRRASLLL